MFPDGEWNSPKATTTMWRRRRRTLRQSRRIQGVFPDRRWCDDDTIVCLSPPEEIVLSILSAVLFCSGADTGLGPLSTLQVSGLNRGGRNFVPVILRAPAQQQLALSSLLVALVPIENPSTESRSVRR